LKININNEGRPRVRYKESSWIQNCTGLWVRLFGIHSHKKTVNYKQTRHPYQVKYTWLKNRKKNQYKIKVRDLECYRIYIYKRNEYEWDTWRRIQNLIWMLNEVTNDKTAMTWMYWKEKTDAHITFTHDSQYYKYKKQRDWDIWQNVGRLRDTGRTDIYQLDARRQKKYQSTKPITIYNRYFCYNHKICKKYNPTSEDILWQLLLLVGGTILWQGQYQKLYNI
jgi:hypothetical protein